MKLKKPRLEKCRGCKATYPHSCLADFEVGSPSKPNIFRICALCAYEIQQILVARGIVAPLSAGPIANRMLDDCRAHLVATDQTRKEIIGEEF